MSQRHEQKQADRSSGLLREFYPSSGTQKNSFYVKDPKYRMDPPKSLWRRERAGLQNVVYR